MSFNPFEPSEDYIDVESTLVEPVCPANVIVYIKGCLLNADNSLRGMRYNDWVEAMTTIACGHFDHIEVAHLGQTTFVRCS